MKVVTAADGGFELVPDPGERIVWTMSDRTCIGVETTDYKGSNRVVHFLPRLYVWFGTDNDRWPAELRNPRQWRLYDDGELVEGPKGSYAPNIHFPKWDD